MERRIVGSQDTAVEIRTFGILLLHRSVIGILDDMYRDDGIAGRIEQFRYVETSADEGSGHVAETVSVHEHLSLPVDSIEVQDGPRAKAVGRNRNRSPVPEVTVEERLGYLLDIVCNSRIRNHAGLDVAGQDSAGDNRRQPSRSIVTSTGDFLSGAFHASGTL